MDPALILSPHLDDAVLSVGQFMAGRTSVVATVCTGVPPRHRMLTSFDQGCGFSSAGDAMRARRREDELAVATLGGSVRHLGLLDSQYVGNAPVAMGSAVSEAVVDVLGPVPAENRMLLAPLGLAHPDHVALATAALSAAATHDVELWLYEELPARVLWPELVADRLADVRARGCDPQLGFAGTGDLAAKRQAIKCYKSQHGALEVLGNWPHTVLVPERLWRCWPCG